VRVILGLTGIGLVNAMQTTDSVIRGFTPAAIVMSAVAGSPHRIGDVVVPAQWREQSGGDSFPVNPALLALVRRGAAVLPAPLHNCTPVPPASPDATTVCLPYDPVVVFAQLGESADPFNGQPVRCAPGGGEIFGCELPAAPTVRFRAHPTTAATDAEAQDMETAAVAGVATGQHVPFIAMRAVSDGAGDPLGDRGFPAQFFDYYRLAAENAALVTRGFLAELDRLATTRSARRICRLLAHHRWRRAAAHLPPESGGT
jgi:adenosylhomocysteine nucleosidase